MPSTRLVSFEQRMPRRPAALFVLGLVLTLCPAAQGRIWVDIGPPQSRSTLPLVLDPSNPATIKLKGKGVNLSLPSLPLQQDPAVTVQLVNTEGNCWEAVYTSAITNDGATFKAVSDAP